MTYYNDNGLNNDIEEEFEQMSDKNFLLYTPIIEIKEIQLYRHFNYIIDEFENDS